MAQNNTTSSTKGTIDTGESRESKELIKNITVFDNLDQNVIRITEDKLKIILLENIKKIAEKKAWITPLGIFITLILIPLTTEKFKDAFSIPSAVWQAGCYIGILIFLLWTIVSIFKVVFFGKITIESVINNIKKGSDDNSK